MQAPTDNLYKFMAIAGLICSIFFYFDYNKRYDSFMETINIRRMEATEIAAKLEIIKKKQDRLDEKTAKAQKNDSDIETWKEIRNGWEANQPLFDEIDMLQAKSGQNIEFIKESRDELSSLLKLYRKLGFASMFLCVVGMFMWYTKTQKFLDIKERTITP